MYDLLRRYLDSSYPDKKTFFDHFQFERFRNRSEGYQWTIEFLVSHNKYYLENLEVRIITELLEAENCFDSIKFQLKAREVAMEIKEVDVKSAWPCDKLFLEKLDVLKLCDNLFGSGSLPDKVWDWLQKENLHLKELKVINLNRQEVKLLSAQLSPHRVSLSYLLEYLLKDFLKNKKRYIQRLDDLEHSRKSQQHDTPSKPITNGASQQSPARNELYNSSYFPNNMASTRMDEPMYGSVNYYESEQHHNVTPHKISCKKCKWDAKHHQSTPNLVGLRADVDQFGARQRKKKLFREINIIQQNMANKKSALAKALALLRVIDPLEVGAHRKVMNMRNILKQISNLGNIAPEYMDKLYEIIGKDGDDLLGNGSHLKDNMYEDLLGDHQKRGVKLEKQFGSHGQPFFERLDKLRGLIEPEIVKDPHLYERHDKNSPLRRSQKKRRGGSSQRDRRSPSNRDKRGSPRRDSQNRGDRDDMLDQPMSRKDPYSADDNRSRSISPQNHVMDDDYLDNEMVSLHSDDGENEPEGDDDYIKRCIPQSPSAPQKPKPQPRYEESPEARSGDAKDLVPKRDESTMSAPLKPKPQPRYEESPEARSGDAKDLAPKREESTMTLPVEEPQAPEPVYIEVEKIVYVDRVIEPEVKDPQPPPEPEYIEVEKIVYVDKIVEPEAKDLKETDTDVAGLIEMEDKLLDNEDLGPWPPVQELPPKPEIAEQLTDVVGLIELVERGFDCEGLIEKEEKDLDCEGLIEQHEQELDCNGLIEFEEKEQSTTGQIEEEVKVEEPPKEFVRATTDCEGLIEFVEQNLDCDGLFEQAEVELDCEGLVEFVEAGFDCEGLVEYGEQECQTDEIVKETAEMETETEAKVLLDTELQTDPEPVIEKLEQGMQTDPEPVIEKLEQEMQTDPEPVIEKLEQEMQTDPEPVIEKFEFEMQTDPEPIIEKKDVEIDNDPSWLEKLLEEARIDERNKLKGQKAMQEMLEKAKMKQSETQTDTTETKDTDVGSTPHQDFINAEMVTDKKDTKDTGMVTTENKKVDISCSTEVKKYLEVNLDQDQDFEFEAMRNKLPPKVSNQSSGLNSIKVPVTPEDTTPIISSTTPNPPQEKGSPTKIPKSRSPMKLTPMGKDNKAPSHQDPGWKGENTGLKSDESNFGPDKAKPKKEEIVAAKQTDEDFDFLKKDTKEKLPKRKAGKRVIRESPFKKQQTNVGNGDSPVSTNSGFKRQLTTGSRGSKL